MSTWLLRQGATPEDGVVSAVFADSILVTSQGPDNWDDFALSLP
ncbi:MAG: hypothetical protein WA628_17950 [Terriglobales bacterium]